MFLKNNSQTSKNRAFDIAFFNAKELYFILRVVNSQYYTLTSSNINMEEFFNEFGFIGKPQARRLQNSPNFCVFKYAQAVKQKVWNEAENRERDWGETLKIRFFSLASHALRACDFETDWFWFSFFFL